MSSDLYIGELDDNIYGTFQLEMLVDGKLNIIANYPGNNERLGIANLPPTPEGWKEAEKIINAFQEWIRHTKQISDQADQDWRDGFTKGLDR